ncbi:MAG: phage antirepressor [Bifidobacterium sp.]|nr:phage antirepressor [Bifidobacterium sp.]
MSNEIQRFDFKGESLRALTNMAGEPWFVAKDACDILGIDTNHLREALDDDEITNLRNSEVWNQPGRAPLIISEPGLYKLIMRSRKPEAKEFQRWVTHEVLPSIRKHGAYMTQQTLDKALTSPDFLIQLATKLKEEQEKVKELEPKAKALDDFTNIPDALLVRDAAKLLSNDSNIQIGEHELRQWLVDNGWIYRQPNQSWCAASSRVRQGHMVMVSSRSHGIHKDGTPFAYPPTPKLARKGLALIHQRLSEQSFERVLDAEVAA